MRQLPKRVGQGQAMDPPPACPAPPLFGFAPRSPSIRIWSEEKKNENKIKRKKNIQSIYAVAKNLWNVWVSFSFSVECCTFQRLARRHRTTPCCSPAMERPPGTPLTPGVPYFPLAFFFLSSLAVLHILLPASSMGQHFRITRHMSLHCTENINLIKETFMIKGI